MARLLMGSLLMVLNMPLPKLLSSINNHIMLLLEPMSLLVHLFGRVRLNALEREVKSQNVRGAVMERRGEGLYLQLASFSLYSFSVNTLLAAAAARAWPRSL